MKRTTLMALLLVAIAALITGCSPNPKFEYQLNCEGTVSTAEGATDFNCYIRNVDTIEVFITPLPLSIKLGQNADRFIERRMTQDFIKPLKRKASKITYDIYAIGYITDKTSGVTFQVNKHWPRTARNRTKVKC